MTNYNNDTLNLIPGETPKAKYEWVKAMLEIQNNIITTYNMLELPCQRTADVLEMLETLNQQP